MTSNPASRRARATILAPRSCPSNPGFATTTRILRSLIDVSFERRLCRRNPSRGRHRKGGAAPLRAEPRLGHDHADLALTHRCLVRAPALPAQSFAGEAPEGGRSPLRAEPRLGHDHADLA